MRAQWYIGHQQDGALVAMRTVHKTGPGLHFAHSGQFLALTGPFKTKRAALWAEKYGCNNPHFQHVSDAERLSKLV